MSRVSVLMSVYNGERYLGESLTSMFDQTLSDFRLIVVDDGSTDKTWDILGNCLDRRLHLIKNDENIGLAASLNKALALSRGEYIARMDADDINLPDRLEKQITFLDQNQDIGILGTRVDFIDDDGRRISTWKTPTHPIVVDWSLRFSNCIAHPSVAMRRTVLNDLGGYNTEYRYGQDYDLWARASLVTKLTNLPDILVKRRKWEENVTSSQQKLQDDTAHTVMSELMSKTLGQEVTITAAAAIRRASKNPHIAHAGELNLASDMIQRLYYAYIGTTILTKEELRIIRLDAIGRLCRIAGNNFLRFPREALLALQKSLQISPKLSGEWIAMHIMQRPLRLIQT